MTSKGGRYIPLGYSAADIASIRPMFQNYLVCGPENDTIDFFAVNIYEWCGSSTFQSSGYADRLAEFQDYPVPTFFSEDGCITVRPRTFTDMAAIYGPNMEDVLSGAFVYEWIQEENDYGIISYPDTTIQNGGSEGGPLNVSVGSPVPLQPEFNNLKAEWASNIPTGVSKAGYTPTNTAMQCPETTPGIWPISGDQELPDTPTKDNPTPGAPVPPSSGTTLSIGTSNSSASGNSSSSEKSWGARTTGEDNYRPWIAFLAACVALGCLV
jgi:1,3-beta-glucanosyltransferase GAS1